MGSIHAWMSNAWDSIVNSYETFAVFLNREPWLTIRRILWVVTAGWVLATSYVVAALGMILSIVFIPFAPTALRFAWLALDIVTLETYLELSGDRPSWMHDPRNPFMIAANVAWLVFFGWGIAMAHLTAAVVQAATIVGIPTAVTSVELAAFALWPFGQGIRKRFLPTTVEELHAEREHRTLTVSRPAEPLSEQMDPYDMEEAQL